LEVTRLKNIDIQAINSVEAVLAELRSLNKQLVRSELEKLRTFNTAYYIVTAAIQDATATHRFVNPAFVEEFSVRFAIYYFQAINDFSSASPHVAPVWEQAFAIDSHRPAFMSLLLGANAHINYDLPLALLDISDKGSKVGLLKDIVTIDKLLMKSGKQILATFDEPRRLPRFIKQRCRFLYFRPVMYMILYWRIVAWHQYKSLESGGTNTMRFMRRSTKIANRLSWLGARLG